MKSSELKVFSDQLSAEIQNHDFLVETLVDLFKTGGQDEIDRFWLEFQRILHAEEKDPETSFGQLLILRRMEAGEGVIIAPLDLVYFGEHGPFSNAVLAERKAVEAVLEKMRL